MYKLHRAIPAPTRAPSTAAALHRPRVAYRSDRLIARSFPSCCCWLLLLLEGPARRRGRAAEEVGADGEEEDDAHEARDGLLEPGGEVEGAVGGRGRQGLVGVGGVVGVVVVVGGGGAGPEGVGEEGGALLLWGLPNTKKAWGWVRPFWPFLCHINTCECYPYLARLEQGRGVAPVRAQRDGRGGGQPAQVLAAQQPDEAVLAPAPPPAVLRDPELLARLLGLAVADAGGWGVMRLSIGRWSVTLHRDTNRSPVKKASASHAHTQTLTGRARG